MTAPSPTRPCSSIRRVGDIPTQTLDAIRTLTDATAHQVEGTQIALGGRMFQQNPGVGPAELIGILAAVVILLVAFGSLLAMGLPILVALFGVGIGVALVELVSHAVTTPDFATQLASMIGIGVGIDYALFIVTRYRQGLADGLDPERAVVRAIDTAGRAVVFAGCTVVISILGLFLMGVDFVKGLAVGTSVAVAVVMLASITLLPALLGFAGGTIDRFSVRRRGADTRPTERRMWFRWSRVIQRRPWPAFAGGLAILVVLAIPLFSMRLSFPDAGGNPTSDTTRRAYDLVTDGFGAGFNGPLVLVAEFPTGADTTSLERLAAALRDTPDVVAVTPPSVNPARRGRYPRHPGELTAIAAHRRPREHVAPRRDPVGVEGERRPRACGRAHRVEHRRVGATRGSVAGFHRRGARAQFPPADGRLPQPIGAVEGGDHEPAVDRRGVWRGCGRVRVGMVRQRDRGRQDRAHRAVRAR